MKTAKCEHEFDEFKDLSKVSHSSPKAKIECDTLLRSLNSSNSRSHLAVFNRFSLFSDLQILTSHLSVVTSVSPMKLVSGLLDGQIDRNLSF